MSTTKLINGPPLRRLISGARCLLAVVWLVLVLTLSPIHAHLAHSSELETDQFFLDRVLPILSSRCQSCHNSSLKISNLDLGSSAGLGNGGQKGPVVVPGKPSASRLYRRIARLEEPFMPMGGDPLNDSEILVIKEWIERGAQWPVDSVNNAAVGKTSGPPSPAQSALSMASLSPNARFFQEQILPILSSRCQWCHNDERKYGGFTLDSAAGLQNGGWHGPVVVPGKPEASRLYRRVARLEKSYMPLNGGGGPGDPLPSEEVNLIRQWIEGGAEWSETETSMEEEKSRLARLEVLKKTEEPHVTDEDRNWWAFRRIKRPTVPTVRQAVNVGNPIDAFILSALEAKGLQPAPLASRQTLIRRLYYDLIGLPPRPEEVEAFVRDSSPGAYERLVDRLLESEHYGERWARHWLDVARFADSDGYEYDRLRPNSWRYRDYVIRALNQDKPYDRIILEQLAGDELPDKDYDSITALGFCRNGPFIGDMVLMQNEMTRMDELDDVVSTTSTAFLGLTLGCARCHNHKYDPIAQKDYYQMVAVFAPSVRSDLPLVPPELVEKYDRQVQEVDSRINALDDQVRSIVKAPRQQLLEAKYRELPEPVQVALKTEPNKRTEAQRRQAKEAFGSVGVSETELLAALSPEHRKRVEEIKAQITTLEKAKPEPLPRAMAITDPSPVPPKSYFLHRGNILSKGSEVFPDILTVLKNPASPSIFPRSDSKSRTTGRRLALAKWIASDQNPLTARVMVNRLWQHHFGKGLVGTPNNFGRMGEFPSHPELMDWLASEFVRQRWSLKAMHRLMLTSRTYQQSSSYSNPINFKKDPENTFLWKMRLQRLEGEAIRDAILSVSGRLNGTMGGPGVFPEVDPGLIEGSPIENPFLLYSRWPKTKDGPELWRRSIYVTQMRTVTAPIMDLFDPPESVSSCPKRNTTTVAPQALQLLNNPFVANQSLLFAERLRDEVGKDPSQQVHRAFMLALGRSPSSREEQTSLSFFEKQLSYHGAHNERLLQEGIDPAILLTPEKAALIDVCHALFNLNEFVYVN
jgi:hypothetical protein